MIATSTKPNPNISGFDWDNARALIQWCAAVYQDGPAEWPPIYSRATDARCLPIEFDDCCVVAFRGSKSGQDYVQDAKFEMWPTLMWDDLVDVHEGFLEDFESIITRVISWLSGRCGKPVFVTGHSLGGAQAVLAAQEIERRGFNVVGVYTFGQPRVGNSAFKAVYNRACNRFGEKLYDITWRIVNQNDIVPRVPGPEMGYRHCGQEVFLPVGGGWILNPSILRIGLSNLRGLLGVFRTGDVLFSEHHLSSYQSRIASLT